MAFKIIKEATKRVNAEGITEESVGKLQAENNARMVREFSLTSALANGDVNGTGASENAGNDIMGSLNADIDKALGDAKKYYKTQATLGTIAAGASIFGSLLTGNKNAAAPATGVVAGQPVAPKVKVETYSTQIENDLSKAIDKFSNDKKITDKDKTKLQAQIDQAGTDRQALAQEVIRLESAMNTNKAAKEKLEGDNAKLNTTKNEQQTAVDNIKQGLIDGYNAQLDGLKADDEAQDTAIAESKGRVTQAKADFQTTVDAQRAIIQQNLSLSNSTPQPVYSTDAQGNSVITGYNPSAQQIEAARVAVKNAEAAIKKAETERDTVIAAEELGPESVQIKALNKKAENEVARQELNAKIANPQSEELTEAKRVLSETITTISNNDAEITRLKGLVDGDTQRVNSARLEMQNISNNISKAQALLNK